MSLASIAHIQKQAAVERRGRLAEKHALFNSMSQPSAEEGQGMGESSNVRANNNLRIDAYPVPPFTHEEL